ncbi:MAG: hypothetical protein FWF50_04155 [Defluviitaleaceae bacterium]|nr:hypothetical protein [Defluviitaleaceae bacterium]
MNETKINKIEKTRKKSRPNPITLKMAITSSIERRIDHLGQCLLIDIATVMHILMWINIRMADNEELKQFAIKTRLYVKFAGQ